jgi:hypothetical protein
MHGSAEPPRWRFGRSADARSDVANERPGLHSRRRTVRGLIASSDFECALAAFTAYRGTAIEKIGAAGPSLNQSRREERPVTVLMLYPLLGM